MTLRKSAKRCLTSEMDRNVRQMMKLIEDNGDSFAQKAEMYYQKRPELISLVEEFYRGYRSLVERYEPATGDLWKNIPSDIQSQASGGVSDNGSEPPSSSWPSPSPRKMVRRISSTRAAGFDFFLGSGGNNNGYDSSCKKDGDACSTLSDSDDEYDDASSINSYSGFFGNAGDHGMTKRVIELEIELREAKDKILVYEQQEHEHSEDGVKINAYEQELKNVNENLRLSQEKIHKLEIEVEKYKSTESSAHLDNDTCSRLGQGRSKLDLCAIGTNELSTSTEADIKMKRDLKFFEGDLRSEKEKVENFEAQIATLKIETSKSNESTEQLQNQLNLAHKETASWKTKFNSEKRHNTELQERVSRLKTSIIERENEIKGLQAVLSETEQKNFFERSQLKTEVRKLLEQQNQMEERLRDEIGILKQEIQERKVNIEDLNVRLGGLILERDNLNEEVDLLKEEMNSREKEIEKANRHVVELESRAKELDDEIERQKIEISEGAEEKREAIRQLCFSLEHYRNGYNVFRKAFIGHKRFPLLAS